MASSDDGSRRIGGQTTPFDRSDVDGVHVAVLAAVVGALVLRLYDLGARVAHWDEGRVGYWILDYANTGNFEYRAIIHGPFYHHVNAVLFEAFGATDVTMRVAVAVLTGLFPLVALLFRERLSDLAVAALAVLLAVTPVLLYYSRFMRGDALVAAFVFTAFALFVRTADTGRERYFYAGVAFVALGLTVKENALLSLLTWVGAAALLLDHRLFRAGERNRDWEAVTAGYVRWGGGLLRRHSRTLLLAALEFLVVIIFFYAPRARTGEGPGLWKAFENPETFPAVLEAATVGAWQELWGVWVNSGHQNHPYLPFLGDFLETFGYGALAVGLLAVVGFLADRYAADGPSDLVAFASYWGFASVLGYPLATDISAPWATVHAVVPLAIPAAVGAAVVVRWGFATGAREGRGPGASKGDVPGVWRSAAAGERTVAGVGSGAVDGTDRNFVRKVQASVVLALLVGQLVVAGASGVYLNPQSEGNDLVQYAQPADDFRPATDRLAAGAPGHEGPDVVLYGEYFDESSAGNDSDGPGCWTWLKAMPLPWYFAAADADVACARQPDELSRLAERDRPPLIVDRPHDDSELPADLAGYEGRTYRLRLWQSETTFYLREEVTDDDSASDSGAATSD